MTGITRAGEYSGTGLYKTSATVSAVDLENDYRLHMTVDKSAIKDAFKATWNDLKAVYNEKSLSPVQGSTLNKVANAIYSVVDEFEREIVQAQEDAIKAREIIMEGIKSGLKGNTAQSLC